MGHDDDSLVARGGSRTWDHSECKFISNLFNERQDGAKFWGSRFAKPFVDGGFGGAGEDAAVTDTFHSEFVEFEGAGGDGVGYDVGLEAVGGEVQGGLGDADVGFHADEDGLLAAEALDGFQELLRAAAGEGHLIDDGGFSFVEDGCEILWDSAEAAHILRGGDHWDAENVGGGQNQVDALCERF